MLSPVVTSPFVPSSNNACVAEPPIEVRLAVTARPVLVGLAPGVTFTVSSDEPPAATEEGLAVPDPVGLVVGDVTFKAMVALPLRACASEIVADRLFAPAAVPEETVALKE